jgi:FtsP/CotA-like multicopper oxidase with cupredoxin domain
LGVIARTWIHRSTRAELLCLNGPGLLLLRPSAGSTVEIAMKFTDYADDANCHMMHCHIAEHEDEGMMTFLMVSTA